MPFGFRLGDLILYFILALLIFGPKKLPEIGAAIGKTVSSLKNGMKDATEGMEVDQTLASLQERELKLKKLELQNIERTIAKKKAELNAYESTPPAEGSSEHADTQIPENHTEIEKPALEE